MADMPDSRRYLADQTAPDDTAILRALAEISRPLNGDPSIADVLSQMQRPNNSYRKPLRARFRDGVVVKVRCRGCKRVLGECYGTEATVLSAVWGPAGATATLLHPCGSVVRWRCRCGASYPVRGAELAATFRTAAVQPTKNDRVIWLPFATPPRRSGTTAPRSFGGGRSAS